MRKNTKQIWGMTKKEWLVIAAVTVIGSTAVGVHLYENNKSSMPTPTMDHSKMSMPEMNSPTYTVNLMSSKVYKSGQPTSLHFDIEQNGKAFKNFALDSTKLMHVIVVRKDRSNFQHVHPIYDEKSGMFTLDNFQFPTDGQYRIFANFAPTNAKKDDMGMIETEAPYVDVNVGDVSKVANQPLGADSLTSSVDGLTATIANPPSDDSYSDPTAKPKFFATPENAKFPVHSTIAVDMTKDGTTFKNLQEYLGNLGHLVVLGPNLEFIHAHPQAGDVNNQTGLILFDAVLPTSGQYRLYLQTQANDTVSTFSFNITTEDMPKPSTSGNNSMQGMNHGGN